MNMFRVLDCISVLFNFYSDVAENAEVLLEVNSRML